MRVKAIVDAFVLVAPDCLVGAAVPPPSRGDIPTVPAIQYELLTAHPYTLTLLDLIYETHVRRAGLLGPLTAAARAAIEVELFGKPVACMRTSALPKKYGWGVHYDGQGRLALHGVGTAEYQAFATGQVEGVTVTAAMRNRRG